MRKSCRVMCLNCSIPVAASHVRRVRVPSQASDVDQFLDDLFSPVLDQLSDARSLAASIKGGNSQYVFPSPKSSQFNYHFELKSQSGVLSMRSVIKIVDCSM